MAITKAGQDPVPRTQVAPRTEAAGFRQRVVRAIDQRERVYVWEAPVRVTHWVTVGSVAVLGVTGAYIADPFISVRDVSVMSTVRFVHMLAAFVLIASGLVRLYWMFAGNRWARWSAFIPTSRWHVADLFRQLGWYLFVRPREPNVVGHNPLAATTYLVVFFLLLLSALTGLALAGIAGSDLWATLFAWVPAILGGPQGVRLIHHLVMWAILAFVVHHVYAALLVDHWEGNGLFSSIFTGFKYLTRSEVEEARDGGPLVDDAAEEHAQDGETTA